ncbi:hypothetical protein RJ640_023839 [Escallonia rubra]|uniref:Integrase zinc-binding domain-containing protein n=1 Tax=Escallonia rubra TaxID=112253 RepID=A0AA88SEI5_9ASTE|nr:hypothetical protein RJ640_023839 [Escallonia rubra]
MAYFWPQMKKKVQMCVKTCHVCQQVKKESQANEAKLLNAMEVLHNLQRREAEYVLWDKLDRGRDAPPKQHYLVKWKGLSELSDLGVSERARAIRRPCGSLSRGASPNGLVVLYNKHHVVISTEVNRAKTLAL